MRISPVYMHLQHQPPLALLAVIGGNAWQLQQLEARFAGYETRRDAILSLTVKANALSVARADPILKPISARQTDELIQAELFGVA